MDATPVKRISSALDRTAWIKAASDTLAEHGAAGLRIETLARKLGVTKGSFYWHFKDRRDLQDAVLTRWKEGRISDIRKQTAAEPGREIEALRHTIEVYSSPRNRKGIPIELAVRDWARHDERAAKVVAAVDAERLDCSYRLFRACGLADDEARARSVMLYAYVFGVSLLRGEQFAADLTEFKNWITEYIVRQSLKTTP